MKKGVLLNSSISSVIARLGHTDKITIADAGLPIPSSVERIDLALTQGILTLCQCYKRSPMKCKSKPLCLP